jgi:lipopolysaccharide/colanic/teichoic acid biosynthesis glycosyltransferase
MNGGTSRNEGGPSIHGRDFGHRWFSLNAALRPAYGLPESAPSHRYGMAPCLRFGWPSRYPFDALANRDLGVLLASAVAPLISPLICRDSPLMYCQRLVGERGRTFRPIKLRTMRGNSEPDIGPVFADQNDLKAARAGHTLRRLRLDELPQMWNLLRGGMSLVGPRPERPAFVIDFRLLPHYEISHLIRPGITGIAQLTGGYSATVFPRG